MFKSSFHLTHSGFHLEFGEEALHHAICNLVQSREKFCGEIIVTVRSLGKSIKALVGENGGKTSPIPPKKP